MSQRGEHSDALMAASSSPEEAANETPKNPPKTADDIERENRHNLSETTNLLLLLALCVRTIVSQFPYSGFEKPPMYGDFEAQRHWQEITVHLPAVAWYENSTANDLQYWGLDYPPLTAYHSWSMGRVAAAWLNASYVALGTSRGITTAPHKTFMRNTVLLADLLLYLPAMWLLARTCQQVFAPRRGPSRHDHGMRLFQLAVLLLFPGQLLIDNGHFQYNNISLALSGLAVAALLHGQLLVGCAAFALALNYKQMVLYHALPVFVFLLRRSVPSDSGSSSSTWWWRWLRFVANVSAKGAVVIGVFAALWWPWLRMGPASVAQVLHRVFPVARGVFEDKVANVWCVLNVVVPLKYAVVFGSWC